MSDEQPLVASEPETPDGNSWAFIRKMAPQELLDSGFIWLVNTSLLHPQGLALSIDTDTGELSLVGTDGSSPIVFGPDMGETVNDLYLDISTRYRAWNRFVSDLRGRSGCGT